MTADFVPVSVLVWVVIAFLVVLIFLLACCMCLFLKCGSNRENQVSISEEEEQSITGQDSGYRRRQAGQLLDLPAEQLLGQGSRWHTDDGQLSVLARLKQALSKSTVEDDGRPQVYKVSRLRDMWNRGMARSNDQQYKHYPGWKGSSQGSLQKAQSSTIPTLDAIQEQAGYQQGWD